MRSAAATVAERGADVIDLNMGCPVPKVCKTGAGAALLEDPDTRRRASRARPREGSGLPVTVKLRSGRSAGRRRRRRARPPARRRGRRRRRSPSTRARAAVHHKGAPDYDARRASWSTTLPAPVILVRRPARRRARSREAFERHGRGGRDARARRARQPVAVRAAARAARDGRADAATRSSPSSTGSIDRAVEHLGASARGRYLRKFYPWYVERLGRGEARRRPPAATATSPRRARCSRHSAQPRWPPDSARRPRYTARPPRAGHPAVGGFCTGRDAQSCPRTSSSPPKASRSSRTSSSSSQTDKRREVAERIKEAREFGDISENSEYDDAKNEQAMLEARIAAARGEAALGARSIDAKDALHRRGRASARRSTSRTRRPASRSKYTIVGSAEADPAESKLSNESPVGKALHGPQARRDGRGRRSHAAPRASSRSRRSTSAS